MKISNNFVKVEGRTNFRIRDENLLNVNAFCRISSLGYPHFVKQFSQFDTFHMEGETERKIRGISS